LRSGKNIVNCLDYFIINKNNIKIGVIGLAEEEWLGLITEIDQKYILYEDYIISAKRLCKKLK